MAFGCCAQMDTPLTLVLEKRNQAPGAIELFLSDCPMSCLHIPAMGNEGNATYGDRIYSAFCASTYTSFEHMFQITQHRCWNELIHRYTMIPHPAYISVCEANYSILSINNAAQAGRNDTFLAHQHAHSLAESTRNHRTGTVANVSLLFHSSLSWLRAATRR